MPESVRDRFSHTWEYILHFTKRPKYYFDWWAVAPDPSGGLLKRVQYGWDLDDFSKSDLYERSTKKINVELAEKVKKGHYKVRPNDVVQINVRPFKDAHFAVYPSDLPEMFIKAATPENGVVLDPFAGAGTTLVVAEKLGRRWIGVEINPNYCEIIKRRFERELADVIKTKPLDEFEGVKE